MRPKQLKPAESKPTSRANTRPTTREGRPANKICKVAGEPQCSLALKILRKRKVNLEAELNRINDTISVLLEA